MYIIIIYDSRSCHITSATISIKILLFQVANDNSGRVTEYSAALPLNIRTN